MTRKKRNFVKGAFSHRRTESDYMGELLEAVTLEDWREIVAATVTAAKAGDTSARTFLAQYLMGRPELKAPAPVTVVVQQLSGRDPLVEKIVEQHVEDMEYPTLHFGGTEKKDLEGAVAEELRALQSEKLNPRKS